MKKLIIFLFIIMGMSNNLCQTPTITQCNRCSRTCPECYNKCVSVGGWYHGWECSAGDTSCCCDACLDNPAPPHVSLNLALDHIGKP